MVNITLHLKDRLVLPSLFPAKVTMSGYSLRKSILNKITITEDEIKRYGIKQDADNHVIWDIEADMKEPLAVEFSDDEITFIKKIAEQRSEEELPTELWDAVDKIWNA